jgi:hypothetical protein
MQLVHRGRRGTYVRYLLGAGSWWASIPGKHCHSPWCQIRNCCNHDTVLSIHVKKKNLNEKRMLGPNKGRPAHWCCHLIASNGKEPKVSASVPGIRRSRDFQRCRRALSPDADRIHKYGPFHTFLKTSDHRLNLEAATIHYLLYVLFETRWWRASRTRPRGLVTRSKEWQEMDSGGLQRYELYESQGRR